MSKAKKRKLALEFATKGKIYDKKNNQIRERSQGEIINTAKEYYDFLKFYK